MPVWAEEEEEEEAGFMSVGNFLYSGVYGPEDEEMGGVRGMKASPLSR